MKVLHVIGGLGTGGAETQLTNLVTAARSDAPRCVVANLLPEIETPNVSRLRDAGVETHHLGLTGILTLSRTQKRLARLIRQYDPDVVQSWMYYADILSLSAMRRARRIGRTKYFWGVRCSDMDFTRYPGRLRRTVKVCAWRSGVPDGVIVNSNAGQRAHQDIGYQPKAWHVIDNGIDTDRFAPARKGALRQEYDLPAGPVAINIARVDPMKDHDTLAATAVACPDWTFVAVGEGTEKLTGPPNLRGLGRRSDVARLAAAADVVLSTSAFGEGFSNALAEGMACGLVPVATDVGDSARLVGQAGWMVSPRSPGKIAEILIGFARMGEGERNARGAAARQRIVSEFNISRMVDRFDRLYRTGQVA